MTLSMDNTRTQGERIWRRRSLWALFVLVPLALFEISYGSLKELIRGNDLFARDIEAGQPARFGGSAWQLVSLKTPEGIKKNRLPAGSVPLIARFLVEVGNPDLQNLWLGCSIKLVDSRGRLWSQTSVPGMPYPADGIMSCSSAIFSGAESGARMVIEANFLVPQDVAADLRVTLGVGSERPYYLRFARSG
ncbi:hypothetical protein CU102_17565 [Phyllobacterium brassicacearum]|uniref:Uncharacterized protein n=2 Tax=Phyllobacterium brassicacearum TaxID=314235 RepID=A0A2P7BMK4_9HYPH|nr:hypothetical protein CU102_17565 [Phyllobacterium brassicacearum]TDQ25934.1 hypothetical protein DEV91_113111 [Phyllobacterium brassicacearum]